MVETVAIIDYGSGNLRSAAKAFERAAREAGLDTAIAVTADPDAVARADRVVLPGVGAFGDCKAGLTAIPGMTEALTRRVVTEARPFFGICVGMQLMASRGLEHGSHEGFGWIPGEVRKLTPSDPALKVPHMGWNELNIHTSHPAFASLPADVRHAYFVHSYHLVADDPAHVLSDVDYGGPTTAIVGTGTMIGTQFHPEKSQALGLALIAGFLRWRP